MIEETTTTEDNPVAPLRITSRFAIGLAVPIPTLELLSTTKVLAEAPVSI